MNRKEAEILFPKLALFGEPTQQPWGGPILLQLRELLEQLIYIAADLFRPRFSFYLSLYSLC